MHQMAGSMFRFTASVARDPVIGNTLGTFILLVFFFLGGFLLPKDDVKPWWIWGYWISPLAYATNAVSVVEYLAPQWNKVTQPSQISNLALLVDRVNLLRKNLDQLAFSEYS